MSVLYISYDGMLEPLGQSQVLAYLKHLVADRPIHLISFEKAGDWANVAERKRIARDISGAGIVWHPLHYHKVPSVLATAFDIMQCIIVGVWLCVRYKIKIIHARSYVSSIIALTLKKLFNVKYIFDMRGFWADERIDGGLWPKDGSMYRVAKWFEKRFLLNADRVVSLTNAAIDEMKSFGYLQGSMPIFETITTCTDLDVFNYSNATSKRENESQPFTLGYVGSVGVWYLFDETLSCFKELQRQVPEARLHILNRGDHDYITKRISESGISADSVLLEVADHAGVAKAMQNMDAGIFIIKPAYSKIASAPTKLGEFLGCGVPCLGNANVGDIADIIVGEKVGVVLSSFDADSIRVAVEELVCLTKQEGIQAHCRDVALRYFSLKEGVRSFDRIYRELVV
mgnify:FL=1